MDPLRADDLEQARAASPEERGRQALEMMRAGFRLKRAALRARHPAEPDDAIEARFQRWLGGDDGAEPTEALGAIAAELTRLGVRFALVGGLAVSVRAEVRFTRDVDVAIHVPTDVETERLVRELGARGYSPVALVEHDDAGRIATVRLRSPSGITVDLLVASSGIEDEIVSRAGKITFDGAGALPVAAPEELLTMKVLSMTDRRLQDRLDATRLLEHNRGLDLERVRANLRLVEERGYHRQQDLTAKLRSLLDGIEG